MASFGRPGSGEAKSMIHALPVLDDLLQHFAELLGSNRQAYTNHVYRVLNITAQLYDPDADDLEKLAIAGAFHDIGLFADRTLDYLGPSETRAMAHLDEIGRPEWKKDIGAMVRWHHKITAVPADESALSEAFRRADWIDVLHGAVTCGIPPHKLREIFTAFPNAGFHLLLVKVSGKRLLTHPWNPMPILRW